VFLYSFLKKLWSCILFHWPFFFFCHFRVSTAYWITASLFSHVTISPIGILSSYSFKPYFFLYKTQSKNQNKRERHNIGKKTIQLRLLLPTSPSPSSTYKTTIPKSKKAPNRKSNKQY
jgi:hypothetical protein